jgi:hypothetical protein
MPASFRSAPKVNLGRAIIKKLNKPAFVKAFYIHKSCFDISSDSFDELRAHLSDSICRKKVKNGPG